MGVDVRSLSPKAQKQVYEKLIKAQKLNAGAEIGANRGKVPPKDESPSKRSKYGAKKVTVNGIQFDSKREARRWIELSAMEAAGEICDLRRQVKYLLIPAQFEAFERYGKRGQRLKDGRRCVEHAVTYVADFVYERNGETIVEDTKGVKTEAYIIKRKLMRSVWGIGIVEV